MDAGRPIRGDPSRHIGILAAAVVAALAGAAGCRASPERITLGTVRLPAMGLIFIAEARGFFADHGIEVVQRRFTSGRDAVAALAAGEVDVATSFQTPVAAQVGREGQIEIVTTLHVATRDTRVIARADHGIARPVDLAGKRIGVPVGTNAEYFLHTLLAFAGVPEGLVQIVDVAPEAAVDAVASGEVDAIAIWSPHTSRARRVLGRAALDFDTEVYTEISVLVTRDSVHQARRPALVKLVRALADAERLVRERPDEAFAALQAEFPEMGEAELRETWGRVRPTLGLTHLLASVLEDEAEWLRDSGRLGGPPLDVGQALDPDVLTEVDPEAVTFVPPPWGKRAR